MGVVELSDDDLLHLCLGDCLGYVVGECNAGEERDACVHWSLMRQSHSTKG
jgi:hypothetical protein